MASIITESEYDKVGDFYYEFVHRDDPARNPMVGLTLSMLGDITGATVCDLACGEGFLSRMMATRGAQVTGVDISRNLIGHARRQSEGMPIKYVLDDAQRLDSLPDSAFDIVVCNMALMDITDIDKTYGAVNRVLRSNGLFLFVILHPCFETPFNRDNPQIVTDADGNFVAKRVTRYGEEGKWFSDGVGMRGTLGSIHRKLSTYVNALNRSGFAIVEMAEPMLPPGEYHDVGDQWAGMVPMFLVIKARKLKFA